MSTLNEIKILIEKSENPLIFFDDDPDGLSSYLLIKKHFGKGYGVCVKTYPAIGEDFLRKVNEYSPDLIIILDIPHLAHEFKNKVNVPIAWIDHHPYDEEEIKGTKYFNPLMNNGGEEGIPTSYWCYEMTKDNLWIAMVGIIGDWSLAGYDEFYKKYKNLLLGKIENASDILFNSKFGELVKIFSFILKDNTSEVRKSIGILLKIENPEEILEKKTERARYIYKKYEKVKKIYDEIRNKAIKCKTKKKILLFRYTSKISFSADLANELIYLNKDKLVIVSREKDTEMILSLRSTKDNLPELIKKALIGVEGYGGGHKYACGAHVEKKDFDKFMENLKREVGDA